MAEFEVEIKEILAQSDINTVSAKKVRTALEERHGISLKERKQEIDQLILKCFDALQEADAEEEPLSKEPSQKRAQENTMGEDSLSEVEDTPKKKPRKTPAKKRTKKAEKGEKGEKEKKPRASNPNSGFNKPYLLSPLMAEIVGAEELPRPEVTKRIWQYIKERDLQDPQDKRYITCDEKLKKAFETDRVHMFTMNKLLSQHLKDKEVKATPEEE